MENSKLKFVEYDFEFLELSWDWLNDPEIREMTMTSDFTKVEQLDFFEKLPFRDNYKIWGVQYRDEKIGVIGLKNISEFDMEYFGYIGVKKYWGKGISSEIFKFINNYAKKIILSEIYLYVSITNHLAVNAYKKNGFSIIDEEVDGLIKMGIKYD